MNEALNKNMLETKKNNVKRASNFIVNQNIR